MRWKSPRKISRKVSVDLVLQAFIFAGLAGVAAASFIYVVSGGPAQTEAAASSDSDQTNVSDLGQVWPEDVRSQPTASDPVLQLTTPRQTDLVPAIIESSVSQVAEEEATSQAAWEGARIVPPPISLDSNQSETPQPIPTGNGGGIRTDRSAGTEPLVVSSGGSGGGGGGGGASLGSGSGSGSSGGGGGDGAAATGGDSGSSGDAAAAPVGVGLSDGNAGSILDEYTKPLNWFSFLSAQGTPDVVTDYGFQAIELIYSVHIWEEGEDDTVLTPVQEARLTERASELEDGQLVCISFEQWELATSKVSIEESENAIDYLIRAVEAVRAGNPTLRIGIYRYLPLRSRIVVEYTYRIAEEAGSLGSSLALMQEVIDRWHEDNVRSMRLAEHVDVVFPSLYTIQGDADVWSRFARVHLDEARVYGKPVYAFIRPRFGQGDLEGELIPYDLWYAQLELLHRQADGVVFWDSYFETWAFGAGWWQATLDYQQFRADNPLILMGD